ncbi:hypothetical protein [Aquabacterium sp. CECT 9606]|jgi:hypothetical protein|uniref:hypothetical protein n=1 Tax=Aquabacterium sp. CECT 9606 TaxID=2845822 RepID=UPI001E6302BE|nr:hypothetical protein [Aquabacterium sp. CECT 9606]CAH0348050.1 hypothetical protein AQB9606_00270 [Aquabacterium sp. CECT 9606]
MTPDQIPKADADLIPPASTEAQREETRRQIEHRFRHILDSGQVSPLFHLVMRYKLGTLS